MKNPSRLPRAIFALSLLAAAARADVPSPESIVAASLAADADRLVAGTTFRLAVVADVKAGWHVNSHRPNEDFLIPTEVSLPEVPGLRFEVPSYPAHREMKFAFSEKPLAVYEGRVVFRVDGVVDAAAAPGPRTLVAAVEFQPCNDEQCLPPARVEARLTLEVAPAGTRAASANTALFGGAAPRAPAGVAGSGADLFAGKSLPFVLALVFLSGLALNLTPCVYPLIPITVGFFARQGSGKTSRTFGLAVAYVLGMSVTYSALGVFAALSGSLFGAWLQKPAVLVGIALLVVALALSMFGLYEIQAPHAITDRTGSKAGPLGALTMGLFVGFVAAPCIGPFVLSLLTYVAAKGSVATGLGLFFTLAMGLGLPYLVLGTASGSLSKLPRSGEWMEAVRRVFGFALLALAVWFLRPLLPPRLWEIGVAVPLLAGGLWILFLEKSGRDLKWFLPVRAAVAIGLLAAGAAFAVPRKAAAQLSFSPYSEAALAAAAGRPVMIDFAADWCLPCKELEHKTFTDPDVIAAGRAWTFLKADLTRTGSPEVEALKEKWRIQGVPTLIFLGPDGKEAGERVVGFEPPETFVRRLAR
ncbi:MAG TPA: cytochrome c biogenesis protein CcdA [Thermoanaerobaculia bacterium]|nr:cytochrome c biogenesis protein CcdA [Thermoanaerobaculia bacterium]